MGLFDAVAGIGQGLAEYADDQRKKDDEANKLQYQTALATGDFAGLKDAAAKMGMGDVSGTQPYFDYQMQDRANTLAGQKLGQQLTGEQIQSAQADRTNQAAQLQLKAQEVGQGQQSIDLAKQTQDQNNKLNIAKFNQERAEFGDTIAIQRLHQRLEEQAAGWTHEYQQEELANTAGHTAMEAARTAAEFPPDRYSQATKKAALMSKLEDDAIKFATGSLGVRPNPNVPEQVEAYDKAWNQRYNAYARAKGLPEIAMEGTAAVPQAAPSAAPPGIFSRILSGAEDAVTPVMGNPVPSSMQRPAGGATPAPGGTPAPTGTPAPHVWVPAPGGTYKPIAPGYAGAPASPTPLTTPNPNTPGTFGPLGRPPTRPGDITPETAALKADILKHYPGAKINSGFRTLAEQAALRKQAEIDHGKANAGIYVAGPDGSHPWGAALDVVVSPHMKEQFKADMRSRGLRAYDETTQDGGGHVHVDDRRDLPNGPGETHAVAPVWPVHPTVKTAARSSASDAAGAAIANKYRPGVASPAPPERRQ